MDVNKIYHGDCLEIMKNFPDKCVDFILCDLPYGVIAPEWDKEIDIDLLWKEYNRLCKGVVALFSCQPFTTKLITSNFRDFKYVWYWIKNQSTNFFHAKRMPLRKVEEIVIFKNGKYNPQITDGHPPTSTSYGSTNGNIYYGTNIRHYEGGVTTRYPTNVLDFKIVYNKERVHPSQKPLDLLEYLIKTYTDKGDLVLDNCIGSGSTALACIDTDRNYIGIEKSSEYYKKCLKRIKKFMVFDDDWLL